VNSSIRGIRYLGQYKPLADYTLADGIKIVPAGSDMFPYGPPGAKVKLNICFFTGHNISDMALKDNYRQWLAFDSFLLRDHFPIFYFDEGKVGEIETIPTHITNQAKTPDYKQIDYGNVANVMYITDSKIAVLPVLDYSKLYQQYKNLASDTKDMIEWLVSWPYQSSSRKNAFFNTNYWQLVHATVLLERLILLPPLCSHSFGKCPVCKSQSQGHHSVARKIWVQQFMEERINDNQVASENTRIVITSISVRNQIAHAPLFDRSTYPELEPGAPTIYGVDQTIASYEHDSIALQSLLTSLKNISRYLILSDAFGIKYYPRLTAYRAVHLKGSENS
jgi:hypothetical protein